MKNSIKKFVVACAAITAISAISATAMAADLGKEVYDADTNSVSITLPEMKVDEEATVLVLAKGKKLTDTITDADILYVNQAANGNFDGAAGGKETLKLLGTKLDDGTYTVAVGYYKEDGTFAVKDDTFTVGAGGGDFTKGDVDGNDRINASDAVAIINYFNDSTTNPFTDTQKLAADVDENSRINASDAVAIINYFNTGKWE